MLSKFVREANANRGDKAPFPARFPAPTPTPTALGTAPPNGSASACIGLQWVSKGNDPRIHTCNCSEGTSYKKTQPAGYPDETLRGASAPPPWTQPEVAASEQRCNHSGALCTGCCSPAWQCMDVGEKVHVYSQLCTCSGLGLRVARDSMYLEGHVLHRAWDRPPPHVDLRASMQPAPRLNQDSYIMRIHVRSLTGSGEYAQSPSSASEGSIRRRRDVDRRRQVSFSCLRFDWAL